MNRKGQALVEFVLILPIFIMILFSIVDFGMIFNKKNELENISVDIINLLNNNNKIEEIQKEYHKEFISEGVMFYYYKRTGCKSIPNYSEEMTDTQYLLPYPTFEIQSGRVQ